MLKSKRHYFLYAQYSMAKYIPSKTFKGINTLKFYRAIYVPVDTSLANITGYILTTSEIQREQMKKERKVKAPKGGKGGGLLSNFMHLIKCFALLWSRNLGSQSVKKLCAIVMGFKSPFPFIFEGLTHTLTAAKGSGAITVVGTSGYHMPGSNDF